MLALVATLALIPPVPSTGGGAGGQARYAFAPRVLAVLGVTFLMFTGLYSTLTYIVPFLEDETGISGALISVFLLAFGVATAVGSFGGGRFADTNAARTPIAAATGAAFSLLALYLVDPIAPLVALVLAAWGVFSFGMVPSLQFRAVSLAAPAARWRPPCPRPRPTWASRAARYPAGWRSAPSPPRPSSSPAWPSPCSPSRPPGRPAS